VHWHPGAWGMYMVSRKNISAGVFMYTSIDARVHANLCFIKNRLFIFELNGSTSSDTRHRYRLYMYYKCLIYLLFIEILNNGMEDNNMFLNIIKYLILNKITIIRTKRIFYKKIKIKYYVKLSS